MPVLLKPFEEMTEADYARIGLKAGLEIHQQLLTEKKLFCRCPAARYTEEYDAEILRHMRPTLSELGEYDGTALMEFKTKKEIIYQINHESVCTYEMDDTPPFEINPQALDIALEIALLMNYKLVSEIHIARKQYLDGSIPTGFQRTTIVGIDGWIPYKDRKIGLIQLGLEEDACREVSDVGHLRIYRTDRLGMPLIETVTRPEMRTPQEVAEVADILRWLVRSTGKVRTGIGAARQDVNVSINGGTRIEIKGVRRIPLIPRLIYNEALRQFALLQIRNELHLRGINEQTFHANAAEVTQLLLPTEWEPIRQAILRKEKIYAVNLKGYLGILSHPTQTGKVFSKEISDRVRVIACLTRLPNILTSESTEETIDTYIWNRIRKALKATARDALILVWGGEQDVQTAVGEIIIRAKEALIGIPSETRQALADGTNGFERILPGPDRMYPDTDLPPLEISEEHIEGLKKNVPQPIWERKEKYKKMGVPEHLLTLLAASPRAPFFEKICMQFKLPPKRIANLLFEKTTYWRRKGWPVERLDDENWGQLFVQLEKNTRLWSCIDPLAKEFFTTPQANWDSLIEHYNKPEVDEKTIQSAIYEARDVAKARFADPQKRPRFVMGKMMERFRGQIDPQKLNNMVSKIINKKE